MYVAEEWPSDAVPATAQDQWLPVQDSQEPSLQWADSLQQYADLAGPAAPNADPVPSLCCEEQTLSRNEAECSDPDGAQVCQRPLCTQESEADAAASKSRSTLKLSRALALAAPIHKDQNLRCTSMIYPKHFRATPATTSSNFRNQKLPPLHLPEKSRRCRRVLGLARPTSRKEETHQLRAALAASLSTG